MKFRDCQEKKILKKKFLSEWCGAFFNIPGGWSLREVEKGLECLEHGHRELRYLERKKKELPERFRYIPGFQGNRPYSVGSLSLLQ